MTEGLRNRAGVVGVGESDIGKVPNMTSPPLPSVLYSVGFLGASLFVVSVLKPKTTGISI